MTQWIESKINPNMLELKCRKCGQLLIWSQKQCEKCGEQVVTGMYLWFPLSLLLSPVFLVFAAINFVLDLHNMVYRGFCRYIIGIPDELLRGLLLEFLRPFLWMIFVSPYPRRSRLFCSKGIQRPSLLLVRPRDWNNSTFLNLENSITESHHLKVKEFQNQWSQLWHGMGETKYRAFRLLLEEELERDR